MESWQGLHGAERNHLRLSFDGSASIHTGAIGQLLCAEMWYFVNSTTLEKSQAAPSPLPSPDMLHVIIQEEQQQAPLS